MMQEPYLNVKLFNSFTQRKLLSIEKLKDGINQKFLRRQRFKDREETLLIIAFMHLSPIKFTKQVMKPIVSFPKDIPKIKIRRWKPVSMIHFTALNAIVRKVAIEDLMEEINPVRLG